jgi:acyl-CoA synthetase (AMP-forming)/AMP-acid ligase II
MTPRADERYGTIPRMARSSAARFADREAIVDGERRLTFRAVERGMAAVARSLVARGVGPGDRVALWAPNSADWVLAALGAHAVGAWLVPLNTRLKGSEAAHILGTTDASQLLVADGFLGTDHVASLRRAGPGLRALGDPVLVPLPGQVSRPEWEEFLAEGADVDEERVEALLAAGSADDVSDVIFTSGTTGLPKGVMLRHGTSLRGYEIFAERFSLDEGDRYVIPTPFFHCFGYKAGWMVALMQGATAFPVPVFDVDEVMGLIERERVTHMPGPPTMFNAVLDHPRRPETDLSSLRQAMIGATSVPAQLVHRVRQELHVPGILSAYGLTENHALATLTEPDDPAEVVATTAGRPIRDVELRTVDDDGNDVPAGEPGEILLRSPYRMTGYYGDEEATARVIVDGWLHTGDVGFVGADGRLRVTDRKKDMFIVGGFNVASPEVERALLLMDEVAEAAVVGMPDDYLGEVGAAFVVPRDGATLTADDVVAFAADRLANFKVPRRVEIVDALPLNATGKVLKGELRARLRPAAATEDRPSAPGA